MSIKKSKYSRRDYLKLSAMGAGAMALPNLLVGRSIFGANLKLNIAFIGGGGIARSAYDDCSGENVVAIADVDDERGSRGFNTFPDAKRYKDFR